MANSCNNDAIARPYAQAVFELASAFRPVDGLVGCAAYRGRTVADPQVAALIANPGTTAASWLS